MKKTLQPESQWTLFVPLHYGLRIYGRCVSGGTERVTKMGEGCVPSIHIKRSAMSVSSTHAKAIVYDGAQPTPFIEQLFRPTAPSWYFVLYTYIDEHSSPRFVVNGRTYAVNAWWFVVADGGVRGRWALSVMLSANFSVCAMLSIEKSHLYDLYLSAWEVVLFYRQKLHFITFFESLT